MKLKPLRDIIAAVPLEQVGKAGSLWVPENYKQGLATHHKALVIASGPEAMESCPPGTIIHVSERWGEKMQVGGKTFMMGRIRDINGILPDERILDYNKYLD